MADLGENLVSYENLLKEKSVKKASIFNRLFNFGAADDCPTVERGERIRGLYIW